MRDRLGPNAKFDSWDAVFKPEILAKFENCSIHLFYAPTDIMPAALNYLGFNPNSTNPADLKRAAVLL